MSTPDFVRCAIKLRFYMFVFDDSALVLQGEAQVFKLFGGEYQVSA